MTSYNVTKQWHDTMLQNKDIIQCYKTMQSYNVTKQWYDAIIQNNDMRQCYHNVMRQRYKPIT